jgi:hypothetical protein
LAVTMLLYDQDTLERHISNIATWSHNDEDGFGDYYSDEQALADMSPLVSSQHRLLERAMSLTVPTAYGVFHQQLVTNLQLGNQRIDIWVQAMADQLHYDYDHAAQIWRREVSTRDNYRTDMLQLRSRKPW